MERSGLYPSAPLRRLIETEARRAYNDKARPLSAGAWRGRVFLTNGHYLVGLDVRRLPREALWLRKLLEFGESRCLAPVEPSPADFENVEDYRKACSRAPMRPSADKGPDYAPVIDTAPPPAPAFRIAWAPHAAPLEENLPEPRRLGMTAKGTVLAVHDPYWTLLDRLYGPWVGWYTAGEGRVIAIYEPSESLPTALLMPVRLVTD